MNHKQWETFQYQLAALPTPQRRQAQEAYCDEWYAASSKEVTEELALRRLGERIEQLKREGKERQND